MRPRPAKGKPPNCLRLRLPDEMWDELRALSEATGQSPSVIARDAVRAALREARCRE